MQPNPELSRRSLLLAAATSPLLSACVKAPTIGGDHDNSVSAPAPKLRGEQLFAISLAEWSLHNALYKGELDHLDFPKTAKQDFGIHAVEYVNAFFKGFKEKKIDPAYVLELRKRCDDLGVRSVLIMCDGEGDLGHADEKKRREAVDNHRKWLDAAATLGCHSIRVNAASSGKYQEQLDRAADGLRQLCILADPYGLSVIVENHWGLSSNGAWLSGVMKKVSHPRVGTLPDFGNFDPKEYDRYQGVTDMMPFAKGVSAKSYDFDDQGEHLNFDFRKMLTIVMNANYHHHIGIEYEGEKRSEHDGIRATKALLENIRTELSA